MNEANGFFDRRTPKIRVKDKHCGKCRIVDIKEENKENLREVQEDGY